MRELEAKANKQAEEIATRFPEVAELFETTTTDIKQLKKNIPQRTVLIQPVLLTGINNVTDTVAIFVLSKDKLKVIQKEINTKKLEESISKYKTQLQERKNPDYQSTSSQLYDIFIRPVEEEIQANSPQQLAFVATGELRYIPFETLYDNQTNQYLIEKYPIHYLTRLSSRSLNSSSSTPLATIAAFTLIGGLSYWTFRKVGVVRNGILVLSLAGIAFFLFSQANSHRTQVLALANPQPTQINLPGTEAEANNLTKIFPGSEAYIGSKATLENFKIQAPRFSLSLF